MRGNEGGGEQKVVVKEEEGGSSAEGASILPHKLRKLTNTLADIKEQFVGQLGDMETH